MGSCGSNGAKEQQVHKIYPSKATNLQDAEQTSPEVSPPQLTTQNLENSNIQN